MSQPPEPVEKTVELIFVPADGEIFHRTVAYCEGLTAQQLVDSTELYTLHPEAKTLPLGVFSQSVDKDDLLKPFDRLEVYRPLHSNPKDKRRNRAAHHR